MTITPYGHERLDLHEIKRDGVATDEFRAFAGQRVMIRSTQHGAWWRPESKGYTDDETQAGIFAFEDAYDRTATCGPEKGIAYDMVPRKAHA